MQYEFRNISPSNDQIQKLESDLEEVKLQVKEGPLQRHKGAKSRSGYSKKIGFEGGQMPLQRRIPKYGFKNINRVDYQPINLDKIQNLAENKMFKKELNIDQMVKLHLIRKNDLVKILGRGKLTVPIKITAHKFSTSAKSAIEAAGGEAITL